MITVEKPSNQALDALNVFSWPIWEKGVSSFSWHYDEKEICYIIEGQVKIETNDGKSIEIGKGDLVTFEKGLDCKWTITSDVKKHYRFG